MGSHCIRKQIPKITTRAINQMYVKFRNIRDAIAVGTCLYFYPIKLTPLPALYSDDFSPQQLTAADPDSITHYNQKIVHHIAMACVIVFSCTGKDNGPNCGTIKPYSGWQIKLSQ